MKILFYSPNFLPKTGGLENMVAMLAKQFATAGIELRLITYTNTDKSTHNQEHNYKIFRNPKKYEVLKLVKWCDVFFQHNVSLKGLWPLLFYKRKLVIAHHTSHFKIDGSITLSGRLKQWVTKRALNICCSSYIANLIPGKKVVIPNCYDADVFCNFHIDRPFEIIFVGRLVSDKGCKLLLEALFKLANENIYPKLNIVGLGPEEPILNELVKKYALESQVTFKGLMRGNELASFINQHQILIVPSIWKEPFGIVALEGLACGCRVIVTNIGGLPEAVGKYGLLFENKDVNDLTKNIKKAINNKKEHISSGLDSFLLQHSPNNVAHSYLKIIKNYFERKA